MTARRSAGLAGRASVSKSWRRGDRPRVVRQTLRAARLDPRLLANRGVASILAQAVVGAARFRGVRWLVRSVGRSGTETKDGN